MRVAKSVVTSARRSSSKTIVGAPLFHRSTRVVRLSDVGPGLPARLHRAGRPGQRHHGPDARRARPRRPGTLRMHALTGFVLGHFAPLLRPSRSRYPDIQLDLIVSDAVVDPVKAGVDCALQIFPAASDELVSRPLFPVRRVFCATPEYLRSARRAARARATCTSTPLGLLFRLPDARPLDLPPRRRAGHDLHEAALLTNSVHLLREYALEHAGIVCLPTLVAGDAIAARRAAGGAARPPAVLVLAQRGLRGHLAQRVQAPALHRAHRPRPSRACRPGTRR